MNAWIKWLGLTLGLLVLGVAIIWFAWVRPFGGDMDRMGRGLSDMGRGMCKAMSGMAGETRAERIEHCGKSSSSPLPQP